MKHLFGIPTLILLCSALLGCSNGPSQKSMDRAMNELSSKQFWAGLFEINNIRKTDSWKKDDSTIVEFTFERKALYSEDEAVRFILNEASQSGGAADQIAASMMKSFKGFGALMVKLELENQYGRFEKGKSVTWTYRVGFYETEEDWRYYF